MLGVCQSHEASLATYAVHAVLCHDCLQCVIAHLENSDVARLLRIYQYVQRYEADWEVAWLQAEQKEAEERKHEPMMADDDAGELPGQPAFLGTAWLA